MNSAIVTKSGLLIRISLQLQLLIFINMISVRSNILFKKNKGLQYQVAKIQGLEHLSLWRELSTFQL